MGRILTTGIHRFSRISPYRTVVIASRTVLERLSICRWSVSCVWLQGTFGKCKETNMLLTSNTSP